MTSLFHPNLPVRPHFDGADICSNRHLGNPESIAAHSRVAPSLLTDRARVLDAIRASGSRGLTAKEYADNENVQLNTISGRFTELKRDGRIVKNGVRDRSGVYVATNQSQS